MSCAFTLGVVLKLNGYTCVTIITLANGEGLSGGGGWRTLSLSIRTRQTHKKAQVEICWGSKSWPSDEAIDILADHWPARSGVQGWKMKTSSHPQFQGDPLPQGGVEAKASWQLYGICSCSD